MNRFFGISNVGYRGACRWLHVQVRLVNGLKPNAIQTALIRKTPAVVSRVI